MIDVAGNVYAGDYGKDAPVEIGLDCTERQFDLGSACESQGEWRGRSRAIGRRYRLRPAPLAGHIDDVTIWRRPLQIAEIAVRSRNLPVP
jgi:hypothetical protein